MSHPKHPRALGLLLFASGFLLTFTAAAQITITGVLDKTRYVDRVTFTVVTQTGFSYAAHLNADPVPAGVPITVERPDYYELQVTRTDNTSGAAIARLVRFLVNASERVDTEWGLPPETPFPVIQSSPQEFSGGQLRVLAPREFPAGYEIPIVAWAVDAQGHAIRGNGVATAAGHPGIQLRRGVGAGFLAATNAPGTLDYRPQLAGLSTNLALRIKAPPTVWTPVSGVLNGASAWAANSRVQIDANLTIASGASLSVGAGTIVRVGRGVMITNAGVIAINGTVDQPVVFMAQTPGQPWGGFVQHANNVQFTATGAIFTQCGLEPCWFTGHGCSSSLSGIGSHRGEQALISLRGVNCNLTLIDCAAIDLAGQLGHSVGGSGNSYRINLTRFLMQRATTGGEYTSANFTVNDSAFIECPFESPEFEDGDNDALYLVGGTHAFTNTLFGWTKDDGVDSGGTDSASTGFGKLDYQSCWFEGMFHEGNSLSGYKNTYARDTVYLDCGQGIEDGYNAPTGRVDHCLFLACQTGVRYGDNYDGGNGAYDGRITATNCILLHNHRDLFAYNWRSAGWTNAWGQMFASNNFLTAVDTNFPANSVWNPGSDAWRLGPFGAGGRVGLGFASRPGESSPTNFPDGLPVGLSMYCTNVVSVDYQVAATDGTRHSGTLQFTPGQMRGVIPLPPLNGGVLRVELTNPQHADVTGPARLYLQAQPATSTPLVPLGSVWRYSDTGADLGNSWRVASFNDSAWPSGPAELGFGETDQATLIASNQQVTTYFRHTFEVVNPAAFATLSMRLKRDDAGVVFLNGKEAYRSPNLPLGPIAYTNFALTSVENVIDTADISPTNLVAGPNLVAVEIHQQALTSSDVSFDFELIGRPPPTLVRVQLHRFSDQGVVHWDDPSFRLQESPGLAAPAWSTLPAPSPVPIELSEPGRFYRLVK